MVLFCGEDTLTPVVYAPQWMAGVNEHITTGETGVDESELLICLLCERQTIAALKSQPELGSITSTWVMKLK